MRRNTKTMYEWRKAYRDKEELMLERGFPEVSPHEFYRDLFPEGSLQSAEHDGKGNLIATQIRPSGKGRTKQWVVDDSLNMLDKVIGDEFGLIPPITFYGKTHTKQNAHELYAVAIEIALSDVNISVVLLSVHWNKSQGVFVHFGEAFQSLVRIAVDTSFSGRFDTQQLQDHKGLHR
jgi:hypothetical protein